MKWGGLLRYVLPALFLWVFWFQQLYFERAYLPLLASLVALGVVSAAIRGFRFNRLDLAFCGVFIAFLLSQAASKDTVFSLVYFRLYILPAPVVYFLARIYFREEDGLRIFRLISAAAAAVSIYGVFEMVSRKNVLLSSVEMTFFFDFFKGTRMMATQTHPAALATLMAAAFPCAIAMYMLEKRRGARIAAVVCCVLVAAGIILCFSRGAFVGFLCSLAVFAILMAVKKAKALILLGAGIVLFLAAMSMPPGVVNSPAVYRFSVGDLTQQYHYDGKTARIAMAVDMARAYPFFGAGPGNFRIFFDRFNRGLGNPGYIQKVPDCMYAALLAETGVTGIGAFLIFLVSLIIIPARGFRRASQGQRIIYAGFFCGMIGMLGSFLTYDTLYWLAPGWLFWSFAGILASHGRAANTGGV